MIDGGLGGIAATTTTILSLSFYIYIYTFTASFTISVYFPLRLNGFIIFVVFESYFIVELCPRYLSDSIEGLDKSFL